MAFTPRTGFTQAQYQDAMKNGESRFDEDFFKKCQQLVNDLAPDVLEEVAKQKSENIKMAQMKYPPTKSEKRKQLNLRNRPVRPSKADPEIVVEHMIWIRPELQNASQIQMLRELNLFYIEQMETISGMLDILNWGITRERGALGSFECLHRSLLHFLFRSPMHDPTVWGPGRTFWERNRHGLLLVDRFFDVCELPNVAEIRLLQNITGIHEVYIMYSLIEKRRRIQPARVALYGAYKAIGPAMAGMKTDMERARRQYGATTAVAFMP